MESSQNFYRLNNAPSNVSLSARARRVSTGSLQAAKWLGRKIKGGKNNALYDAGSDAPSDKSPPTKATVGRSTYPAVYEQSTSNSKSSVSYTALKKSGSTLSLPILGGKSSPASFKAVKWIKRKMNGNKKDDDDDELWGTSTELDEDPFAPPPVRILPPARLRQDDLKKLNIPPAPSSSAAKTADKLPSKPSLSQPATVKREPVDRINFPKLGNPIFIDPSKTYKPLTFEPPVRTRPNQLSLHRYNSSFIRNSPDTTRN